MPKKVSPEPAKENEPGNFLVWAYRTFDDWFFGAGSPLTLGVFRAIMGGLITINLLMLIPFYGDWFTEHGYVPAGLNAVYINPANEFLGISIPRINLYALVSEPPGSYIIFGITLAAAIAATVGWKTRISTIVLALGIVSLHHRNGFILHGGDTAIRMAAIYMAIAPSGLAFSLDRKLSGKRDAAVDPYPVISVWPQRLIQVQVAIVYFTSTWHKYQGNHWREGDAVWYPMHLNEFYRFPMPSIAFSKPMIMLATYGTLLVQLSLCTLVFFRPLRKYVLFAGMLLHLGIDYSMNIPLFSYLMIGYYISFYDGDEILGWWKRMCERIDSRRQSKRA